jgi:hypothetical protein
MTETKPCQICGTLIARPEVSYPSAWKRKNTCSRACAGQLRERRKRPDPARYLAARSKAPNANGCIEWKGRTQFGYGRAQYAGRQVQAHILAWEIHKGPVPEGLDLDHLCRNRRCLNPLHLEPVTLVENVMRGESPPAKNARKLQCDRGHDFDEKNTAVRPNGHRHCRTCRNLAARNYRRAMAGKA